MTENIYVTHGQSETENIMFTCNEIWTVKLHLLWTCFDQSIQNK